MRGVGDDRRRAHHLGALLRARDHRHRGSRDHRPRPQRVDGDAVGAEFLGHPQHAQAHPVLGDGVGDVVAEPFRIERRRRREHQHLRHAAGARRRLQRGQAGLRAGIGAADIDAEHQVEALHRRGERAGEADGAGVVDQDVDAAEGLDGPRDGGRDRLLVADVAGEGQRAPAGGLDLRRGGVDRAGQLRVRRLGLGGDRDVGAVARGAQRDRQPDAARRAGDEQRAAGERRHGVVRRRGFSSRRTSARASRGKR